MHARYISESCLVSLQLWVLRVPETPYLTFNIDGSPEHGSLDLVRDNLTITARSHLGMSILEQRYGKRAGWGFGLSNGQTAIHRSFTGLSTSWWLGSQSIGLLLQPLPNCQRLDGPVNSRCASQPFNLRRLSTSLWLQQNPSQRNPGFLRFLRRLQFLRILSCTSSAIHSVSESKQMSHSTRVRQITKCVHNKA